MATEYRDVMDRFEHVEESAACIGYIIMYTIKSFPFKHILDKNFDFTNNSSAHRANKLTSYTLLLQTCMPPFPPRFIRKKYGTNTRSTVWSLHCQGVELYKLDHFAFWSTLPTA